MLYSQNADIIQFSGEIKNDSLEPLSFVHILVINKNKGTITDFNGYFSFPVQNNDTILFTYIGYKPYEFIVPDTLNDNNFFKLTMIRDTIFINEIDVFPWSTYEQFKHAFLTLYIPDDDYVRAERNMQLIKIQQLLSDYPIDGSQAYKHYMNKQYNKLYYSGFYPTINILGLAELINAIKRGDFKNKKKKYKY